MSKDKDRQMTMTMKLIKGIAPNSSLPKIQSWEEYKERLIKYHLEELETVDYLINHNLVYPHWELPFDKVLIALRFRGQND